MRPGDSVLANGTLGDHGIAIIARREGLDLGVELRSDMAPLNGLVAALRRAAPNVRSMRDITRGRLAAVANEVVRRQAFGVRVFDAYVGDVVRQPSGMALVETAYGRRRVLETPIEEQLPRIC